MNKLKLIFLSLFLAFCIKISGQQLQFKHLTNEDGLSSLMVNCITQDNKGFMWFGTQDGLNKYDGYQILVFKHDPTNQNSLNSSDISAINQLREDLIIIGTREGLNYFNPVTEAFISLKNVKALNSKINSIAKADDKNVWIGSDEGLFLLNVDQKTVKNYEFIKGQAVIVNKVAVINKVVYVATKEKGLWIIDHGEPKQIVFEKLDFTGFNLTDLENITDIKEYAGKIYLSTHGSGIFKMDADMEIENKILMRNTKDLDGSNFIKAFEIRESKIYAATSFGFYVYNLITNKVVVEQHKDNSTSKHGLGGDKIESFFIDKMNDFWLGFESEGIDINFFQSKKFPASTQNALLKSQNIYAFNETSNGEKLIGGTNTLFLLDENDNIIKDYSAKLAKNAALCIYKQNDQFFWVGTYGKGLFRLDIKTDEFKEVLGTNWGGTILCLISDGKETLYAGSVGDGLFKINLTTLEATTFKNEHTISDYNINTMYVDKDHHLWFGLGGGGLIKTKGFAVNGKFDILKIFKNESKPGQISSNIINAINEDSRGSLWVATATGLSRLVANDQFVNFYEKDGLPNSYLYSILKDSLNNFWMSSNKGLIKFNPLLNDKDITFKHYDSKDGLVNSEYNSGAAFIGKAMVMYFGGPKGYNSFRPSSIKDNFIVPNAYIVSYKRGGKDVTSDSSIIFKKYLNLTWSENYFQFELVALDYTDPAKNRFKYKLEGYDKEWSAPTNVRYVSYNELDGGDYTFKVKAANNDGVWNETPYEIHITVVPPFWKTKLFYAFVIIIIVGGFYGFTQYRTAAIKKENKRLENKVTERTKELAEKNRDITSSIEYAKRIQEAILPAKEQIFSKLKDVFILYKPKDIVSGDFYWFSEKNNCKIFAVVDCTGHGVPGAFMSMIGHNLLNQIIQEKGIVEPAEILNNLHKGIQEALRQGQNEISTNDGMDVSIISIGTINNEVKWAGANRPLIMINTKGEFIKFDGNKFPVGGAQVDINRIFSSHVIRPTLPSVVYMFTDGFADQFGGEKGKKYMVTRFHDLLTKIHLEKPEDQKKALQDSFDAWRKNLEQVDDVLVVGIAI